MAGNNAPQFTKNGILGAIAVTAANTSSQGGGTIGTDIFLLLTSDATNGTFVEFIRAMPTATAAATNTTATVARFFISTQPSGVTTAANTHLIGEITLAVQSADSSTTATSPIDFPLNERLPAGYTLLVTNHAAPAASTQWKFTAYGGDY